MQLKTASMAVIFSGIPLAALVSMSDSARSSSLCVSFIAPSRARIAEHFPISQLAVRGACFYALSLVCRQRFISFCRLKRFVGDPILSSPIRQKITYLPRSAPSPGALS